MVFPSFLRNSVSKKYTGVVNFILLFFLFCHNYLLNIIFIFYVIIFSLSFSVFWSFLWSLHFEEIRFLQSLKSSEFSNDI